MSSNLVLSLIVLGAMAALAGAILAWRKGQRKQAVLMVVLALVMAANLAIWTVPDSRGAAPMNAELR